MVKSQIVQGIKHKWVLQGRPLTDILVNCVFELSRTCLTTGGKKFYQHNVTLTNVDDLPRQYNILSRWLDHKRI